MSRSEDRAWRCHACGIEIEVADEAPRCPRCLRKSTVVAPGQTSPGPATPAAGAGRPKAPAAAPHPAWVILGAVLLAGVLSNVLRVSQMTASTGYLVGSALGILLVAAGAAWALERGFRGLAASHGRRRVIWLVVAAGAMLVTILLWVEAWFYLQD